MSKTIGEKIVHHLYPNIDAYYLSTNSKSKSVQKVLTLSYDKASDFCVIKNFKGKLTISGTNKYGNVILDKDEIVKILLKKLNEEMNLKNVIKAFDKEIEKKVS